MERLCLSLHCICQGFHCHIITQVVEDLAGDVDIVSFDRHSHIAGCIGDSCIYTLARPHRCGHCNLFVGLSNSQIIISVTCGKIIKFYCRAAAGKCLLRQRLASVYDNLHFGLTGGVCGVGYLRFDINLVLLVKDRAHCISVQGIQNGEIIVLCGVYTVVLHCVVNRILGKSVGEHNASCCVGIAPVAFVVVLIVGRRHVPSLIEGSCVIAVGREISRASDSSLAVSYLNQRHLIIDNRIIQCKIHEITERISRMVELGDGLRILIQGIIVSFQYFIVVAFSVRLCISVFKSFRIKCIDMSRCSAGPGHLKPVDSYEIAFLCCDGSRALTSLSPGSIYFLGILIAQMGCACTGKSALPLK